ncbi:MAG TPA: peptidylprolyl isomerase [Chloroflexota bacterium]|nr:peptidylprolyl isomerase [Chloroflexota bacterium]
MSTRPRRGDNRRGPLQKPKGITYVTVTAALLVLFAVTLGQAACSSQSSPPPVLPTPAASTSAAPSASAVASGSAAASPAPSIQHTYSSPPPMTIDVNKKYTATIDTEKGQIVLQLDPSIAPVTVNNFVFLAQNHFYDGLKWWRVAPGFVIQGGDPTNAGPGGPGYKFKDELPKDASVYTPGCVAMANSGPNTNGSQFFICSADDTKQLQPLYSYFGKVTSGMDVVQQITTADHMLKVTIS